MNEPTRTSHLDTPSRAQPDCVLAASTDFTDLALSELRSAAPKARVRTIAPGVHLVTGIPFAELSGIWAKQPPVFVRHIAPIDFSRPIANTTDDIAALAAQI